jgi:hypothetical protein
MASEDVHMEDVHMEDLVDSTTDWSSSDSDDSDLDEVLNDDDMEVMLVLFGMKQLEDRAKLLDQRKGSTMGRVCTTGSCMANEFLHSFRIVVCVKQIFVICLIAGTFVICLILSLEHLLTVLKNIIVIIMMIIV